MMPGVTDGALLPIPHHLVYFEPTLSGNHLLEDGTNPQHNPGAPFVRRMWAGGNIHYSTTNPIRLDGSRAVCVDGIRSVTIKGLEDEEKVFVGIERRMGHLTPSETRAIASVDRSSESAVKEIEDSIRERFWRDDENDPGECGVLERRNIVFLQRSDAPPSPPKILKPTKEASLFRHTIVPNQHLLFRFSALTFNAHAIHLDRQFTRDKEGHRNLLFHGPMGYAILLTMLRDTLKRGQQITFVDYRNLAPLYCDEEVTFCAAQSDAGKFDVWIEGPDGGVKMKGTVKTTTV